MARVVPWWVLLAPWVLLAKLALDRLKERRRTLAAPETAEPEPPPRASDPVEKLIHAILISAVREQVDVVRLREDGGHFRVLFERDDECWELMRPPVRLVGAIILGFEDLIGCEMIISTERIRPVLRYGTGTDLLQIEVNPVVPWARKWRSGKKLAPLPQA